LNKPARPSNGASNSTYCVVEAAVSGLQGKVPERRLYRLFNAARLEREGMKRRAAPASMPVRERSVVPDANLDLAREPLPGQVDQELLVGARRHFRAPRIPTCNAPASSCARQQDRRPGAREDPSARQAGDDGRTRGSGRITAMGPGSACSAALASAPCPAEIYSGVWRGHERIRAGFQAASSTPGMMPRARSAAHPEQRRDSHRRTASVSPLHRGTHGLIASAREARPSG